jgi:hypothetical protein
MYITRKVISAQDQLLMRAAVERARVPDAWMSTLILLLDPFQRATDRNGAQPCVQPKTQTDWFGLAKHICIPSDELDEGTEEKHEADETGYFPEAYLDPVYDRYRGFTA